MKITAAQLRRIIKEEVQRTLKSQTSRKKHFREAVEEEFLIDLIEIPEISSHADGMEMSVDDFVRMVMALGSKYPSIKFEAADGSEAYSEEYDTLTAFGTRADLVKFASKLDEEMMGGAQSIGSEDSFVNFIRDDL